MRARLISACDLRGEILRERDLAAFCASCHSSCNFPSSQSCTRRNIISLFGLRRYLADFFGKASRTQCENMKSCVNARTRLSSSVARTMSHTHAVYARRTAQRVLTGICRKIGVRMQKISLSGADHFSGTSFRGASCGCILTCWRALSSGCECGSEIWPWRPDDLHLSYSALLHAVCAVGL